VNIKRIPDPVTEVGRAASFIRERRWPELRARAARLADALEVLVVAASERKTSLYRLHPVAARRAIDDFAEALQSGRPAQKLDGSQRREEWERLKRMALKGFGKNALRVAAAAKRAAVEDPEEEGESRRRRITRLVREDLRQTYPSLTDEYIDGEARDAVRIFEPGTSRKELTRRAKESLTGAGKSRTDAEADEVADFILRIRYAAALGRYKVTHALGLESPSTARRRRARPKEAQKPFPARRSLPRARPRKSRD
jgi:hypothetical protein